MNFEELSQGDVHPNEDPTSPATEEQPDFPEFQSGVSDPIYVPDVPAQLESDDAEHGVSAAEVDPNPDLLISSDELAAASKEDLELVKNFLSNQEDKERQFYLTATKYAEEKSRGEIREKTLIRQAFIDGHNWGK